MDGFEISIITDSIKSRIRGKSYHEGKSIPYEEIRYLNVLHYGFDGKIHQGELIVHHKVAEAVVSIMKELYEHQYPIEKMNLVDEYNADDLLSMEANNSSAFNHREIAYEQCLSKHSYGIAIDINPLYNPYIKTIQTVKLEKGEKKDEQQEDAKQENAKKEAVKQEAAKQLRETVILPPSSAKYVDREQEHPYMIKKGDICYNTFIRHGFSWGGEWEQSKDYQHFEYLDL